MRIANGNAQSTEHTSKPIPAFLGAIGSLVTNYILNLCTYWKSHNNIITQRQERIRGETEERWRRDGVMEHYEYNTFFENSYIRAI